MEDDTDVAKAMVTLTKALKADDGYAYGWHANIAMAMFDSMPESFWMPDKEKYHDIANEGASRFMKLAFGVETSDTMLDE